MPDPKEFSAEAVAIATLEVVHRVLDHLVERQIMTDDEVAQLFAKAAEEQRLSDLPANQEAAELLADIAKARAGKWRGAAAAPRGSG